MSESLHGNADNEEPRDLSSKTEDLLSVWDIRADRIMQSDDPEAMLDMYWQLDHGHSEVSPEE